MKDQIKRFPRLEYKIPIELTHIKYILESGYKPLLRKLPSMTEEEANLWFDFHYRENGVFNWRNCFEVNQAGAEFWINYHSSRRNRRHVIKFDELNAYDFHYLLSKGFDLFNLIPEGLALDKDTLHN